MTSSNSNVNAWDWQKRWEVGLTQWQKTFVDPNLIRFWPTVSGGQTNLRVLVPLCGATLDMGWIYRQGHRVVGIEMVRIAADKAFELEGFDYSVTRIPSEDGDIWKYQSSDGRYIIYVSNFLKITSELIGKFNVVYDRRALEAMKVADRPNYVDVVTKLLEDDFSYHLSGFDFTPRLEDTIPPRPLGLSEATSLFAKVGDNVTVSLLRSEDDHEQERVKQRPGIKLNTYLIKSSNFSN